MKNKTKRQHYVPQFYLRSFSHDGSNLYAYDKQEKKSFESDSLNIAHEKFFYELPKINENCEELEKIGLDEKTMIEDVLKWYDGICADELQKVRSNIEASRVVSHNGSTLFNLTDQQKLGISFFAVLQNLRTKEAREKMAQMSHLMTAAMAEMTAKMKFPDVDFNKFRIQTNEDHDSVFQSQMLLDMDHLEGLSRVSTFGRIWMLGINKTKTPFMISDHPIIMRSHDPDPFYRSVGWMSSYLEIGIPLTPQMIIMVCCPLVFRDRFSYGSEWALNNTVRELSEENVLYYNSLQCSNSYRFIYSPVNDWTMVEKFLGEFPHHGDPSRQKVMVSGFGGERKLHKDWRIPKGSK